MKALTWDAATRLFKEVITGRIFTDPSEPADIADGDLWIDSSSTPVLKARVGGTIYEVVGAGGGGPCSPAMLADDIVNAELLSPVGPNEVETIAYELHTADDSAVVTFDTLRSTIIGLTPAGYWQLNDAASPPQDSSGNARHASATTGTTYRTTVGGGPGNYVTLPSTNKIPVTNNNAFEINTAPGLTVFFLARPTAVPSSVFNTFVCVGPSNWEWAIQHHATGAIHAFTMQNPSGNLVTRSETAAATVDINQWQAICVTISDVTSAATIDVYKNSGTPLAKTVVVGSGSAPVSNTGVMQIGAQTDVTTRGMIGSMAHFAVFPGVMSGANIQTIMDAADADGWF